MQRQGRNKLEAFGCAAKKCLICSSRAGKNHCLNVEQLLLKKPHGKDSIDGGWWSPQFLRDTVLSGNRSSLVEFLWSFLWHVCLSSCQERARGVLPEWALDDWLQPGTAGGQHGAALRPCLRGGPGPRAPPRPGPHHRTPHHWGERLCLPLLALCSCFAWWECAGKNWRPDGAPRNLTGLWAFKLDHRNCTCCCPGSIAQKWAVPGSCWFPSYSFGHWLSGRQESAPNGAGAGSRTLLVNTVL